MQGRAQEPGFKCRETELNNSLVSNVYIFYDINIEVILRSPKFLGVREIRKIFKN